MKLFGSFLTIQANGSRVYLILRAATKQALEQAHYSLYNFGATETRNPEYHSNSNINVVATCLSSWAKLQDYFYRIHRFKFESHNHAYLHSIDQINELKKEPNQEIFFKFQADGKPAVYDGFNFGTIENEEIDDIKDAIVIEGFKEKKNPLALTKSSGVVVDDNNIFPEKKSISNLMTVVEL